MSQKKVDKYKETKAHRGELVKKQKRVRRFEFIIIIAVIAAALIWFGVSIYNSNKAAEQTGVIYIDSKDVVDYMNDPSAATNEEAEAAAEEEITEAAAEAETEGETVEEEVIDEALDAGETQE